MASHSKIRAITKSAVDRAPYLIWAARNLCINGTFLIATVAGSSGCASSSDTASASGAATLRPGVEDSNQAYKGVANAHEIAFWEAVRNADDAARADAVEQLKADVSKEPTNGYSEFLIGASQFMPPNSELRALANGTPTSASAIDSSAAGPYLTKGLSNLTDPFYLGFDGSLLGGLKQDSGNDSEAEQLFAAASNNNYAATSFGQMLGDLAQQNFAAALNDVYAIMEFCNNSPLDRSGVEVNAFVKKQNAGTLIQRECYSGYHAAHGSEGLLLIAGDLHALTGNPQAAATYYTALQSATNYSTWALKPLVQRRLDRSQVADAATATAVGSTCATCHTNTLP